MVAMESQGDTQKMTATIQDALASMRMNMDYHDRTAAAAEADWRLSDAAKKQARDVARDGKRAAVLIAASTIFDHEAGLYWKEEAALTAKLRAARDMADADTDHTRLANTYKRIPSIVAEARTVQELEAWYSEQADTYERRAFQDLGAEAVMQRFTVLDGAGSFVGTLKRDRAAAMTTPELQKAERELAALAKAGYEAHRELRAKAAELGGGLWDDTDRVLSRVSVDARFTDASRADAPVVYTVERRTGTGYIPIKEV